MIEGESAQSHPVVRPKVQAVVTGITDRGIVQFDFIYGDPDLTVELVLPVPAFRDFCTENLCLVTAADAANSSAVLRLVASTTSPVRPVGAH